MADEKSPNEATEHADLYHRHGEADPEGWEEQEAVTGRENDTPLRGEDTPAVPNSTLASRAKARGSFKRVDDAENKAVAPAEATDKAPARRGRRK